MIAIKQMVASRRLGVIGGICLVLGAVLAVRALAPGDRQAWLTAPAAGEYRPVMVWVPGGMTVDESGVERWVPPLAIARTEVTERQWTAVMGSDLLGHASDEAPAGGTRPVYGVTPHAAMLYCNRLSQLEALSPCYALDSCRGNPNARGDAIDIAGFYRCEIARRITDCLGYRLPRRREWMHAAHADANTTGWVLATGDALLRVARVRENSGDVVGPHPVMSLGPASQSPWGLFDVFGNVREWLDEGDGLDGDAPGEPTRGDDIRRLATPCGWMTPAAVCRALPRPTRVIVTEARDIGFRPARSRPPSAVPDAVPAAGTFVIP